MEARVRFDKTEEWLEISVLVRAFIVAIVWACGLVIFIMFGVRYTSLGGSAASVGMTPQKKIRSVRVRLHPQSV